MLKHEHLVLRAEILNPPGKKDCEQMNEWFRKLISDINMKVLMGPFMVYSDVKGNRGFTGVAIIETSHIALHCWDEDNPAVLQLDIYTCSKLPLEKAISALNVFEPVAISYQILDRETEIRIK